MISIIFNLSIFMDYWSKISKVPALWHLLVIKSYNVPIWIQLNVAFMFCIFRLFFFLLVNNNITWFYYTRDKNTVYALYTHCLCTVHVLFMGPTILFTHLKIILLPYFQFSVFNFSKNKFNLNRPIVYWKFEIFWKEPSGSAPALERAS